MPFAVIGLAFVLLIVFAVLSAKQWHWLNIVFLILTFLVGVAATAAMAQCYQRRLDEQSAAENAMEDAMEWKEKARMAVFGSVTSIEYDADSLRGLDQLLQLATYGRGRVWNRGTPTADGNNREFAFEVARDAKSNMETMVLFAFADGLISVTLSDGTVVDQIYPLGFIGSFRVVTEANDKLTLEPDFVADEDAYASPQGTWSLYEKMPLDRRDAFRKAKGLDDDIEIAAYREILQTEYMPPERFGLDAGSAEYEALIDRFAFDGRPLGDIRTYINTAPGRISTRFEPLKEEVFFRYKFNKAVKQDKGFTVDGSGSLIADGPFSPLGASNNAALHLGGKATFKKDDTVLIDQTTAEGYQRPDGNMQPRFDAQYDVDKVDEYYYRQLNNYPYLLASLRDRAREIQEETERTIANNAVTDAAWNDTANQQAVRDAVKDGLESDQQNLRNDLAAISELNELRTRELSELEAEIAALEKELEAGYQKIISRDAQ